MPTDVAKHFVSLKFTVSGLGTLREVIENATTTRCKMDLNGLESTKGQSISVNLIKKTGMEVEEYCTFLTYGTTKSYK